MNIIKHLNNKITIIWVNITEHQQYYNAQNQNQNNMNGVRRGNNFNHKGHKKSYINPNIICSISDDEATTRANNHNGHKNNGYNNRGSSERTGKRSVTINYLY